MKKNTAVSATSLRFSNYAKECLIKIFPSSLHQLSWWWYFVAVRFHNLHRLTQLHEIKGVNIQGCVRVTAANTHIRPTFLIFLIIQQRFCSDCTVAKNVNLQRLTINLGRKLAVVKVNIMDSLKESSTLEIAFGAICCSGTLRTLLTTNFRIRGDITTNCCPKNHSLR